MNRRKSKPFLAWPYVVGLILLFCLSIVLRAAEVVGPKPVFYSAHPLDDDSTVRLVAIQKNFNSLAQPPWLPIKLGGVDAPSIQYLVLINAGDERDVTEMRKQFAEFETTMNSIRQTQIKPDQMQKVLTEGLSVPILMYHRTPADFESQIKHLVDRGYTSITLANLRSALITQTPLPAKPVIITLDDGYTDQLHEIAILQKYKMRATLYIINGSAASKWCIGANSKNGPGCEPYLNWDQIRKIDRGGLITIGSHTINHPDLSRLSIDQQRAEIIGAKRELEKQLGHSVNDFAYPYGSFDATSVQVAQEAGFLTAVTTQPGITHTAANIFTLMRVRDTLVLP